MQAETPDGASICFSWIGLFFEWRVSIKYRNPSWGISLRNTHKHTEIDFYKSNLLNRFDIYYKLHVLSGSDLILRCFTSVSMYVSHLAESSSVSFNQRQKSETKWTKQDKKNMTVGKNLKRIMHQFGKLSFITIFKWVGTFLTSSNYFDAGNKYFERLSWVNYGVE